MSQDGVAIQSLPHMESVDRVSKLPIVGSTIQTATSLYGKVKDYNNVTNWTCSTAESTVNLAVEVGKPIATPVINKFEQQIKKVDGVLCSGLDYVENKVPAVKMPAEEIRTATKDYYKQNFEPAVDAVYAVAAPTVKTAKNLMQPAVDKAMSAVEPVVVTAKQYVEPALNTINAVKENFINKVEEYLHEGHHHENTEDAVNCEECKRVKEAMLRKAEEKNDN